MPAQCKTRTHAFSHLEVKQHRFVVEENYVGVCVGGIRLTTEAGLSLLLFIECDSDERPSYVLLVYWLADCREQTSLLTQQ